MPTIPNLPTEISHEHHAWHDGHAHPELPTRVHPLPTAHSGEEFLVFHRDLMFRTRSWLAAQPFAANFDIAPWTEVPDVLKRADLGWNQWANDARRLSEQIDSFKSEDELGIFIEGGIHNNFLHGATATVFGEPLVR